VTGAVKRANGVDKSSADRLEQAPDPVGAGEGGVRFGNQLA